MSNEVGLTVNHQPKAAVHAVKSLSEALASAPPATSPDTNAEVVPHARRRQFSNADKRRILGAADRCTRPGEVGALMRREGVYSSSLSTWRRQREVSVVTLCDAAMFKYVDGRRRAPCESGDGAEPHRRCSEGFLLIGSRCDRRIDAHVVLLVVEAVDLSAVVRLESEHQFMKEVEDFDG